MYGLIGVAVADGAASRRIVGVTAQGMNACPCAQGLLAAQAAEGLRQDGFSEDEVARIVEIVPIATHNQRARGTLYVGSPDDRSIDADALLAIVEDGMSSEIYELMKRPDEQYVVERAHRRPRFVEDSVREMVRGSWSASRTCRPTRSSTPTRPTSRPSTPTTSRRSAPARSARSGRRWRARGARSATRACGGGSTAPAPPAAPRAEAGPR
jgi:hypothetical protein